MSKLDPIIAVKNVTSSSKWYQKVFGCKSIHGGDTFDVLIDSDSEVLLCLHKWDDHGHPTMLSSNNNAGNGLILYFRMENLEEIRATLKKMNHPVEQEIQISPNSNRKEFSLRDLDGYFLTIAEFHQFDG